MTTTPRTPTTPDTPTTTPPDTPPTTPPDTPTPDTPRTPPTTRTSDTPPGRLRAQLARARRRLALRKAVESMSRVLPWAAALLAVPVAAQLLAGPRSPFVLPPLPLAGLAAAALSGILLVAAVHGALAARLDDLSLALLVDRGLDTRERLTAAIALRDDAAAPAWERAALAAIGDRDVRAALPLRPVPWRSSLAACAALAGAFALPALPSREAAGEKTHDTLVVEAARQLEEEAEEAEEEIAERGAGDEALAILADVRKSAQRAQVEPMTREETLQDLQRLDQQARREQERRQAADAGALQRALSSIEQASLSREGARQAGDEEARSLEKQLQSLASDLAQGTSFEERDVKRMAARIRDAADALAESHPELSEGLSELADAIERGDMKEAERIARELAASAEMQQLSADAATGEALDQARRMVQQAMASLGEAPTDAEMQAARAAAAGQGDGPEGEGRGLPGDAPGMGRDRAGVASVRTDWGVGTTNEASPEFRIQGRGQQASRQSTETSDWREAYEALHDATHLDAPGRNTRVSGKLGEGEMIVVPSRQVSRAPEAANLPRLRVPQSYARANEEAMAREEVPAAYEDSVRRYFTSLDAPSAPAPPPAPPSPESP